MNIYFNPKKIEKIRVSTTDIEALKQIGFLWIHEVSHVLREHNARAAELSANPEIWNIAADLEINDSNWEGLEPPKIYPGIFPHHYKMVNGELAEKYYQLLTAKKESEVEKGLAKAMEKLRQEKEKEEAENKKEQQEDSSDESDQPEAGEEEHSEGEENEKDGAGGKNPDDEEQEEEGDGEEQEETPASSKNSNEVSASEEENENDSSDDSLNDKEDTPEENAKGNSEKTIREQYADMMDEGSGVHNEKRAWELTVDGEERQSLDDLETEHVRMAVAKEMEAQLKAGTLPAGWERWANLKLNPQVDWRKVLRHRLSRSINYSVGARTDYSFLRPSRRQSVYDPLLPPALSGDITGQIACVVDTSASISDAQLTKILGEVWAILKTFNLPVTLIPCDAEAYDPILLKQPTDIHKVKHIPGGGGTNMIRGIEAALKLKTAPDVVVVLTDGYTPYPEKLYKTPVLFGIYMPDMERTNMLPGPPWRDDLVIKILLEQ